MAVDGIGASVQASAAIYAMKASEQIQAQQVQTLMQSTAQATDAATNQAAQVQDTGNFIDTYA